MVIDIHSHRFLAVDDGFLLAAGYMQAIPPSAAVIRVDGFTFPASGDLSDPARQQDVLEQAGVSLCLISDFTYIYWLTRLAGRESLEVAKRVNDGLAETAGADAHATVAMASVCPFEKAHVGELDRALSHLGLKGCCVPSSWGDRYLDSPLAYPLYEYLEAAGTPLFLHPPLVSLGSPAALADLRMTEAVGRVFDTTLSVSRMILSGVFDRFPRLKVIVPHMGAGLMAVIGRLDTAVRMGFEGLPHHMRAKCQRMPREYLSNLYVDTVGFWSPMLKQIVDVFGADHVLFGSDYPAVPISPGEHIAMVEELEVSDEAKRRILYENAVELFDLAIETVGGPSGVQ